MIVGSKGGLVVPEADVNVLLPNDRSLVTEFNRRGMVCVLDAWVEKAVVAGTDADKDNADVHRQVNR